MSIQYPTFDETAPPEFADCIWDYSDEFYRFNNKSQAVQDWVEKQSEEELADLAPEFVLEIAGARTIQVQPQEIQHLADHALDDILETLDEEHQPFDAHEQTPQLKAIALKFAQDVVANYHCKSCDQVCIVRVNVANWFRENS